MVSEAIRRLAARRGKGRLLPSSRPFASYKQTHCQKARGFGDPRVCVWGGNSLRRSQGEASKGDPKMGE